MEKYIDKSALVAEIENIRKHYIERDDFDNGWNFALDKIISLVDTLEVKEVDLEKELDKEWNKCEPTDEGMGLEIASIEHEQFDNIAKHFFELGIKAQKGDIV